MAFDNRMVDGDFVGAIVDPIPLLVDEITGDLSLHPRRAA
jgi:hypothetical protein